MAKDFKPHYGRITLTSILGQGILHELDCADSGELILNGNIEPCKIGLYAVNFKPTKKEIYAFAGKTQSGKTLNSEECETLINLNVKSFTESGRRTPAWLRSSSKTDELDNFLNIDDLLKTESQNLTAAQAEEVDKINLRTKVKKSALSRLLDECSAEIKALERELQSATNDRMQTLTLERKLSALQTEFKKSQESQFFQEMLIDIEAEKQKTEFLGQNKLTATAVRHFILSIGGRK